MGAELLATSHIFAKTVKVHVIKEKGKTFKEIY